MKTITLKSIEIKNFKGISEFNSSFSNRVEIYGRNGLGKTSILDAFLWCLFGKDSTGASSFSVKPLDKDGKIKDHHDVDVMCILTVDGVDKSYRRKWVEKRSKKGDEFKGNEGAYYVNDVPVKESEYSQLISQICKEELFKLITSTGAFNRMKDADKRLVLSGMSDKFTDEEIAAEFPNVLDALKSGKSIDQYKIEIKSKRGKAELELEQYPTRLKENADSRPIIPDDIDLYQDRIDRILSDIESYDAILKGATDHDLIASKNRAIQGHKEMLFDIESQCRKEIESKRAEIESKRKDAREALNRAKENKATAQSMLTKLETNYKSHVQLLDDIAKEWHNVNSSTIDTTVDEVCPTCGKPFSQYDIDVRKNEIVEAFNRDKIERLNEINKRGSAEQELVAEMHEHIKQYKADIEEYDRSISSYTSDIAEIDHIEEQLPTLSMRLQANKEYQNIRNKLEIATRERDNASAPSEDAIVIANKKSEALAEVSRLRKELAKLDEIARLNIRKEELEQKQIEIGQLVANYKKIEAEILAFSMKKTSMIEQSVSDKFRLVKFKMFEHNLTNDGVREVCICTVNGVPYKDLNTAMQYNADIDIINALSSHYDIVAPVFIDRAESINEIENTAGQRIDLYATKEDTILRVEHK